VPHARALARLAGSGRAVGVSSRDETRRDRDRDREAYALFLSFMLVIHVSHNPLY
jgi:hypothetical protein